jgi:hypothetical protein
MTLLWVAYGYSLAFGDGGNLQAMIGNFDKAFLRGVSVESVSGTIPESLFLAFQMTFAIITPALIVGAFAERMKFSAFVWGQMTTSRNPSLNGFWLNGSGHFCAGRTRFLVRSSKQPKKPRS